MGEGLDEFEHFVRAQDSLYRQVLIELAAGRKQSDWMWFVFPQLRGLGQSMMSDRYAIDNRGQAIRYLSHNTLGRRLRECTELVLSVHGRTAEDIFGYPDCMKLHSSLTLFSLCSHLASVFSKGIDKYFRGELDPGTIRLLYPDCDVCSQRDGFEHGTGGIRQREEEEPL